MKQQLFLAMITLLTACANQQNLPESQSNPGHFKTTGHYGSSASLGAWCTVSLDDAGYSCKNEQIYEAPHGSYYVTASLNQDLQQSTPGAECRALPVEDSKIVTGTGVKEPQRILVTLSYTSTDPNARAQCHFNVNEQSINSGSVNTLVSISAKRQIIPNVELDRHYGYLEITAMTMDYVGVRWSSSGGRINPQPHKQMGIMHFAEFSADRAGVYTITATSILDPSKVDTYQVEVKNPAISDKFFIDASCETSRTGLNKKTQNASCSRDAEDRANSGSYLDILEVKSSYHGRDPLCQLEPEDTPSAKTFLNYRRKVNLKSFILSPQAALTQGEIKCKAEARYVQIIE